MDQEKEEVIVDEFGVEYSVDGTRVIKAPGGLSGHYKIKPGTKVICEDAFYWCESLLSITIPASVAEICGNPFRGCAAELINESPYFTYEDFVLFSKEKDKIIAFRKDATSYTVPDTVTSIGNEAFCDCSLESITIPGSVKSIGEGAFEDSALKSVELHNGLIHIGDHAFCSCSSLTNIEIPSSVTSIGRSAFSFCDLRTISIPEGVKSIDCISYCKSLESIKIPDSVASIGYEAFFYCESLRNIVIPDSVTSIGEYAFSVCKSLVSITLPDSVTSIGDGAFEMCESLKDISNSARRDSDRGWGVLGLQVFGEHHTPRQIGEHRQRRL